MKDSRPVPDAVGRATCAAPEDKNTSRPEPDAVMALSETAPELVMVPPARPTKTIPGRAGVPLELNDSWAVPEASNLGSAREPEHRYVIAPAAVKARD